jgi:O-methyltransferase
MLATVYKRVLARLLREIVSRGYLHELWYPKYQFQYFSRQLCFLAECISKTCDVEGAIIEVGCAYGLTTTFLYEYMIDSGINKTYYCIDTFSGFTASDISVEKKRGKDYRYDLQFRNNHVEWFKESLRKRHITDINVIPQDICNLDQSRLPERVAFCLLDVDLYQPVKRGLEKIYPRLSPGGIIIIDDCWNKPAHLWVDHVAHQYDGAMQAYREFIAEKNITERIVETKLAVVERPR